MKHVLHNRIVQKLLLCCGLFLPLVASAQIGIGTTTPHPSAMIHISAGAGNNKGLIMPKITSASRVVLDSTQNLAHGLVFFDTDLQKFYYFHQSPKQWYELDHDWIRKDVAGAAPVIGNHIYLGVSGNVGIGTASTLNPPAKVTVVGNMSIGNAQFTQDSVPPGNSLIVRNWIGINTATRTNGNFQLDVNGEANITRYLTVRDSVVTKRFRGEGVVPTGGIIMWSGTITGNFASGLGIAGTEYEGWALCDGRNGTPDLRGRFIVGMRNGDGNDYGYVNTEKNFADYDMHDTGGEREHVLTEAEMPSHSHSGSTSTDGSHNHGYTRPSGCTNGVFTADSGCFMSDEPESANTASDGNHSHSLNINDTGLDAAHENRPPFYTLAFIMKMN